MRDSLYDEVLAREALPTASRTANAAVNGTTVDKSVFNNFFRVVSFVIQAGTLTDGTTTVTMEDSDNGSSWAVVTDTSYVQGTIPVIASTADNALFEFAYIGPKRYVRIVATQASATSGGVMGAIALLAQPRRYPVARS